MLAVSFWCFRKYHQYFRITKPHKRIIKNSYDSKALNYIQPRPFLKKIAFRMKQSKTRNIRFKVQSKFTIQKTNKSLTKPVYTVEVSQRREFGLISFVGPSITFELQYNRQQKQTSMLQFVNLTSLKNNLNLCSINTSFVSPFSHLSREQSAFQPKPARLRKKKIYNPQFYKGKWTPRQQLAYIHFLQTHYYLMENSLQRKFKKAFLTMSYAIQTRDADQCRSHHQKMFQCRSSVAEIIKYYRSNTIQSENRQNRDLKQSQKTLEKTVDPSTCMDVIYQPYRVFCKGSNFKIWIQSQRMVSYDF